MTTTTHDTPDRRSRWRRWRDNLVRDDRRGGYAMLEAKHAIAIGAIGLLAFALVVGGWQPVLALIGTAAAIWFALRWRHLRTHLRSRPAPSLTIPADAPVGDAPSPDDIGVRASASSALPELDAPTWRQSWHAVDTCLAVVVVGLIGRGAFETLREGWSGVAISAGLLVLVAAAWWWWRQPTPSRG